MGRIADRLALSLEREHVAEAAKRADEANARAAQVESRVRQLTDELDARTGYRRVIGESVAWREVLKKAAQVAAVETTVLLLGESGTGKEGRGAVCAPRRAAQRHLHGVSFCKAFAHPSSPR